MDINRLKQILSSSTEIEVQYNGVSVWVDKINEDGQTATVHLGEPFEERTSVAIADLQEAE